MSEIAARAALSRMNMQVVALAPQYSAMGLSGDLHAMASTKQDDGQIEFLSRRGELCAAFGLVSGSEQRKPFAFDSGYAIIPVSGTLVNRFSQSYSFVTGYNFIRAQLNAALADDDVKGIIFDVNSFGGEAAGCFELAVEIKASRDVKPSIAVVDSNAYSAGYAIASAATQMVSIPSGGVGSIGVIVMHVDMSKMLDNIGVKYTLIYEGENKADGNPFEPLPDSVKAEVAARIHQSYESFCALVADNRGIDIQVVRDTQSRGYRADEALALGLIDAVASPSQAVQAFFGGLSGSTQQLQKEVTMTTQATTTPGAQATAPATTQTAAAAPTENTVETLLQARQSERARITGITGSEEAKGRATLANHLAMTTEMSVDQARAILAASPQEAAPQAAASNPFKEAMDASKHPGVGANDTAAAANGEGGASVASLILAAQTAATGRVHAKT